MNHISWCRLDESSKEHVSIVVAIIKSLMSPQRGQLSLLAIMLIAIFANYGVSATHGGPAVNLHLPGRDGHISLDISALESLPQRQITTSTVWTQEVDAYQGVMLLDLLLAYDIDPSDIQGRVIFSALDGYTAEVDFALIGGDAPLLAYFRNGKLMPRRSQGPFWLIFPYDDAPEFRSETIYSMSVWQVETIMIRVGN